LACGPAWCGFAAAGAGLHAAGAGAGADVLRGGSPAGTGALPADDRELAAPRGTGGGADRPVRDCRWSGSADPASAPCSGRRAGRSEEHTSELQSRENLVCRLLLEKKKK